MIAHITTRSAWEAAQGGPGYTHASLSTDGFIHCSTLTAEQLLAVANAHFAGQAGLVLLIVDPAKLGAVVKYEEFEDSGSFFPHVYGPINTGAVTQVMEFAPEADGTFKLPKI